MVSRLDRRGVIPGPSQTLASERQQALAQIQAGASALGLDLRPDALNRFDLYIRELLTWGDRLNLTAACTASQVAGLHLLDSMLVLAAVKIPKACHIVDVGTGAGFPGVPMKIVRPDLLVTLVEASRRRVAFLEHLRNALDLPGMEIRWARAEEMARDPAFRDAFGLAVSRATAKIGVAVELCLPLVAVGGAAVLLKGPRVEAAAAAVQPLLERLGGSVEACDLRVLPTTDRQRAILILRKQRPTPPEFPRRGRRLGLVS